LAFRQANTPKQDFADAPADGEPSAVRITPEPDGWHGWRWADFVVKLDKEQLPRNNRIEAREFLNQHCAWALDPELMLLAGPLKIVLQQNRPEADFASLCAIGDMV